MSSFVNKYKIKFDGNDGLTYEKEIYCKFENVWDGQLWRNSDGTPVDFACLTDSEALVTAKCIANIPTEDKYFYWEKIENFELPEKVANEFNYKTKEYDTRR